MCLSDGIIEMANDISRHFMVNLQLFNGDGFYKQLIIIFIIRHFDHITRDCPHRVSYIILVPCVMILPEIYFMYHCYHELCQQWQNKDVQLIKIN